MAWIKVGTHLPRHRRIRRFATQADIKIPEAIGHLVCLWLEILDQRPDGIIEGWDEVDVSHAAQWLYVTPMLPALISSGLIDESPLRAHNWDNWSGEYLKGLDRRRAYRERLKSDEGRTGDVPGTAPGTVPGTAEKEQKRIEEKEETTTTSKPFWTDPNPMNGADPDWTKADVLDTVFQTWQEVMKHPTAKLTRERERLILARLRDGYAPFQMVKAVRGCAKSAYHMGENENGTVYDSLGLILRNGEKVEQFMGYADVKKKRSANSFPGQGGRS